MAALDHPLKAEIEAIRRLILDVGDGVKESVKWNAPSFSLGSGGEHFATFHLRRPGVVQVVLHSGAKKRAAPLAMDIPDPQGLLAWQAKDRAIVGFTDSEDLAAKRADFEAIVLAWADALRTAA